jgi:acetoin utilization protein AcuB
MELSDVMTHDFLSISPQARLWQAAQMMMEQETDTLLVVEEDHLLGILGLRDLFTAPLVAYSGVKMRKYDSHHQMGEIWQSTTVQNCMNETVLTVDIHTPLMRAAELITNHGKHLLPVLSNGRVVGTISRKDVVRAMLSETPVVME